MKKLFILASVILLAASCSKSQTPQTTNDQPTYQLGQEVTLQKGESVTFSGTDVSLKLTDFYNHPCQQGQQCFWSGQDVYYVLTAGGKDYAKDKIGAAPADMPYDVQLKDSDYASKATFIVSKKTSDVTLNTYTSPDTYGFSFQYPSDFSFDTNPEHARAVSYIPVCGENMVACAYLTREKNYPGTNFDGAGVSVNIDKSLNTEAKCYNFKVSTNEAQTPVADVTINSVTFKSATGGGGAAGHSDELRVYRNFRNGLCYELSQDVAATNIDNYPTGTIKEFSQDDVWKKLQSVVNSFTFTK